MHDRLLVKGVGSGLQDFCKFWKISDNIFETVQNSDIVTTTQQPFIQDDPFIHSHPVSVAII